MCPCVELHTAVIKHMRCIPQNKLLSMTPKQKVEVRVGTLVKTKQHLSPRRPKCQKNGGF